MNKNVNKTRDFRLLIKYTTKCRFITMIQRLAKDSGLLGTNRVLYKLVLKMLCFQCITFKDCSTKILELFLDISYVFRKKILKTTSIDFDFCNLSSFGDVVYEERCIIYPELSFLLHATLHLCHRPFYKIFVKFRSNKKMYLKLF